MKVTEMIEKMVEMKKTNALLKSEEAMQAWKDFTLKNTPIIIEKNHDGWDCSDRFHIHQVGNQYVILTLEEYWCLGSPDVDYRLSNEKEGFFIRIEPVKWVTKKVSIRHWEDGVMKFEIADIPENRAKYFQGLPGPDGFEVWKDQEYRDFDCQFDSSEYDCI